MLTKYKIPLLKPNLLVSRGPWKSRYRSRKVKVGLKEVNVDQAKVDVDLEKFDKTDVTKLPVLSKTGRRTVAPAFIFIVPL